MINDVHFPPEWLAYETLEIPGSILIANRKPFCNKDFIHEISADAKKKKNHYHNNGDHGMLKNSCTNYWWVNNE
jgi:hypothetical protein